MKDKDKINELLTLALDNEKEFLQRLEQNSELKDAWEEFKKNENIENERFFKILRWKMSSFNERELDKYLTEEANKELCDAIESSPLYQQYLELKQKETSWDQKDEERAKRLLNKVRQETSIPDSLVFCWDDDGNEIIKDDKTGKILAVITDTKKNGELMMPKEGIVQEQGATSKESTRGLNKGISQNVEKLRTPTEISDASVKKFPEYPLPKNQGKLIIYQEEDHLFTIQLQELPTEYNRAQIVIICTTEKKEWKKKVLKSLCVFKQIPPGHYTISWAKEEQIWPIVSIRLPYLND